MRMFNNTQGQDFSNLFHREPQEFTKNTPKELLKFALGATLYMPATRENLLEDINKMTQKGVSSLVICLEDSIPDNRLEEAEGNLKNLLMELSASKDTDLPLLFCRVRTPEHYAKIIEQNGANLAALTGMVFPKFDHLDGRGEEFMKIHKTFTKTLSAPLYYMPVIESPAVMHRETRKITLQNMRHLLDKYGEALLAVRVGATDMNSAYALRRHRSYTIYDVHVVSSAIADIINVLGRAEDQRIITGPVWEHFKPAHRNFKPMLRESIFKGDKEMRNKLLTEGYDNFIREIELDKLNGITGKTIIHPSHISIVHSLLVVNHEEYHDAMDIISQEQGGGAYASLYKNKMNEVKPHLAWAKNIEARAKIFGVSKEGIEFIDFLERYEQ